MEIVPDCESSAEKTASISSLTSKYAARRGARLRMVLPIVCVVAIVLAPLLASLVRIEAGLLVMAIALSATAMLLHTSMGELPSQYRRLMRGLLVVNIALALACFAAAVIRWRLG